METMFVNTFSLRCFQNHKFTPQCNPIKTFRYRHRFGVLMSRAIHQAVTSWLFQDSAQSPIGRNIAVIRRQYAIHVIDINVKHAHRQYPFSHPELSGTVRCILELLCISNIENDLPGFTKSDVDTMINALCTC